MSYLPEVYLTAEEGKVILDELKFEIPSGVTKVITDSFPLKEEESCYVFILECAGGNYYISRTKQHPFARWAELVKTEPCQWTALHKPLKVIDLHIGDTCLESFYFFHYVQMYGIAKVRGCGYHKLELTDDESRLIVDYFSSPYRTVLKCCRK